MDRNIIEFVIVGRDKNGKPVDVSVWHDEEKAREVLEQTRAMPDVYHFHPPYEAIQRTIREEGMGW